MKHQLAAILFLVQALLAPAAASAQSSLPDTSAAQATTPNALSIASVRSRKTHGAAGAFDLVLVSSPSDPTTEPRSGGPAGNHLLVFVFSEPVTRGTASVTEGAANAGTPTFNGNEMLVPLFGVANAQYVTVSVNDVNGTTSGSTRVGFLAGDVNGSRVVTLSDLLMVNAALTQPVTSQNFLRDVNVSGTLSLSDMLLVNANETLALPPPTLSPPNFPAGSVAINGGAPYTASPSVTLTLNATDDVGVTGYWLAPSGSNPPSASAIGWTPVTPTQSFTADVPYTFAFTADGSKTVYAWYKDAAGNVSAMVTGSIILDRTVPINGTLTATASRGSVTLIWSGFSDSGSGLASSNAYTLVSSTAGSPATCSNSATVSTIYTGSATTFTQSNLTAGSVHYYRVCATDAVGNTNSGATASATPTANTPPIANAGPDQIGTPGTTVFFDATGSSDPDGSIVSYTFSFGDGLGTSSATGVLTHAYVVVGTYTMTLTVTDNSGATSSDTAVVTIVNPAPAQGTFRSVRAFGGVSSDAGNAIAVDAAGNVVVVGTFQGTADLGGLTGFTSSAGSTDLFIVKYSASGQFVCARQVGGAGDDRSYAIKADSAGSLFITGSFQGTVDFGGLSLTSTAGSPDVFIAKYSPNCGPVQWVRNLGSSTDDVGYGLAVDRGGDVIVTGYFSGSADFGAGAVPSSGPFADVFIVKYAGGNGGYQWAHTLYGPSIDIGRAVAVDGDGNVVVTGSFQSTVSDGTTFQPLMTSAGSVDFFLLKYSAAGAYLWSRSFGGTGDDVAYGVDVDSGGNIAVVGSFQNTMFLGGSPLESAGLSDTFVAKFSPMGNHLWSVRIGGTDIDVDYAVAVDRLGNVVMTGGYQFNGGQWDILVAKYSAAGAPLWFKSFGSSANDVGFGVASDASGNVFVTGYFQGSVDFDGTTLTSAGLTDGFVLSLGP